MEDNKMKVKMEDDFLDVLDKVITKGRIEKEFIITPELRITMRVLDTWETITAEALSPFKVDESSIDLVHKTRHLNKVIRSIVSINGVPIESEDLDDKSNLSETRRVALYKKLGKLPTSIIDKIVSSYMELCKSQDNIFAEADKNVENF